MTDTKISALTAATTPLAGTEVLPIVQSGVTKQVSVANVTAGRSVSALNLGLNGVTSPVTTLQIGASGSGTGTQDAVLLTKYSSDTDQFRWLWNYSGTGYLGIGTSGTSMILGRSTGTTGAVGATYATIDSSGNITANIGNLVIGTSGKGIDFSADSHAAGMTSELFDDYEEGTWTPTWNGGSVTINNTCYYTKIGRQVTVTADITFGTSASASDSALTLPFTGLGPWGGGSVNYTDISATVSVNVQASSGTVNFRSAINGGNLSCVLTASKRVIFIASYFTS